VLPHTAPKIDPLKQPIVGNLTVDDNILEWVQIAVWKAIGEAKSNLQITVKRGVVTLSGHLAGQADRDAAVTAARQATVTENVNDAVASADFVYTDVWLSMGEDEAAWSERIALLTPYRITRTVMNASQNPFTKFMHCLPAFHNAETEVGADIQRRFGLDCMEVTDEVFESDASIVFDQAENRTHTIKAALVATIGG